MVWVGGEGRRWKQRRGALGGVRGDELASKGMVRWKEMHQAYSRWKGLKNLLLKATRILSKITTSRNNHQIISKKP